MPLVKNPNCLECKLRCFAKGRRNIDPFSKLGKVWLERHPGQNIPDNSVICNKCRVKVSRNRDIQPQVPMGNLDQDIQSPKRICIPFSMVTRSKKKCVVCNRAVKSQATVMPVDARMEIFVSQKVLIPHGMRCCVAHLNGTHIDQSINLQSSIHPAKVTDSELIDCLTNLHRIANESSLKHINFENPFSMSDDQYKTITGLTIEQFSDLLQFMPNVRSTQVRGKRTALGVFLMKMRSGLSLRFLATIMRFPSHSAVAKTIHGVRKALLQHFVPDNIGFGSTSREDIIDNHTSTTSKVLFSVPDDAVIIVLDGTYLYIEKSGNYTFQRRTYSMHKGRPLVKPMVITTTSGYIISILGPYLGKNNDAAMIEHIFRVDMENIQAWLHPGDVGIVDRGFRDACEFLGDLGIDTEMPCCSHGQLTTSESNDTRFVTKVRWVVEAVNGRIKQWTYFKNVISNSEIEFVPDYLQIIGAVCNKYRPDFQPPNHDDEAIALKMLAKSGVPNHVQARVEQGTLSSRGGKWDNLNVDAEMPIDGNITDTISEFPQLSEASIRGLTFGVYQLKQAKHYSDEHLLQHGKYEISVHPDAPNLVRARLQSRHTTSKKYFTWIEYDNSSRIPITGWYCTCNSGARVVGCCAHVTCIIWYLGFARHQGYRLSDKKPMGQSIFDSSVMPAPEDDVLQRD